MNTRKEHPSPLGYLLVLCVITLLANANPVSAAYASVAPATPPVPAPALGDPQELETFMDGLMASQLAEQHVAGAVVVVVKGGQVLLAKGYGYADVDKRIPVDAERTLFRTGSVTKLFTWTAVMQLVEQGKIDLQADVNTYLTRFQIPATYPQPITMLDLMSHTPGFEDLMKYQVASSVGEMTSLEDYLAQNIPVRVYPPGQVPAYSNYGAALAGYIVEQVSGEPYAQYVDAHILAPLGMDHSTMEQPLPESLAPDMSQGYSFDGAYQAEEFDLLQVSPAGALSASGRDMARFMLAHLQDGEYDSARILKAETAQLMHTQSYTFDPALPGMAHGFMESQINGQRLIGHGGDLSSFHTLLSLIPEEQTGIYVSYNSTPGPQARETLLAAFMDRYFPAAPLSQPQPTADSASRVACYSGDYAISRMAYSTAEKALYLVSILTVKSGPDNTLLIPNLLEPSMNVTLVEVRPLVMQNMRTGELVVFHEDARGQVRYAALGSMPHTIGIRLPWYGRRAFQLGLLGFSLLTFLLTVIAALVALFLPRVTTDADVRAPRPGRPARWVALALCVLVVGFVIAQFLFVNNLDAASLNQPPVLLRMLPWAVAALALAVTFLAAVAWWTRWWGLAGRLHYTVIASAALAFLWFEVYWSLV